MKLPAFHVLMLIGGWLVLRKFIAFSGIGVDLLYFALLFPTLWAIDRIRERLWGEEPRKRLAAGAVFLFIAAIILSMASPLLRALPAPADGLPLAEAMIVALYLTIAGAAALSMMLLAGGGRDSLSRWRHYPSKGR